MGRVKAYINYTGLETAESALWCTNHATLKTAHTTRNQHANILLHILQVCRLILHSVNTTKS